MYFLLLFLFTPKIPPAVDEVKIIIRWKRVFNEIFQSLTINDISNTNTKTAAPFKRPIK